VPATIFEHFLIAIPIILHHNL